MDDEDLERIKRAIDSPEARALLSAAAIAGFALYAGNLLTNPKARRNYVRQVKEAARERAKRDAWHERKTRRIHARWDYFRDHGDQLWAERALVTVGPEKPFPDAMFERLPAGFRHTRFAVDSRRAGARIEVGYDLADRDGNLALTFDDGRTWRLGILAGQHDLRQHSAGKTLPDLDMARFACRLLAASESAFSTITLVRPESSEIREQIWRDHVAQHPDLADEPWPLR